MATTLAASGHYRVRYGMSLAALASSLRGGQRITFDTSALYQAIGEYVIAFQWLENRLWLAASFAEHPEQAGPSRWALVDLSMHPLIDRFERSLHDFVDQRAPEHAHSFKQRVSALAKASHDVRRQRNRLLHSAYIFLEAGDQIHGVVRSNLTWRGSANRQEPVFDQGSATPALFRDASKVAVETGFQIGLCYVQLIHWHRP